MNFLTTESTEHAEKEEPNSLTGKIIGAAIEIHRALGPGLLESVSSLAPIHEAQLLSYLKLSNCKILDFVHFCAPYSG